MDYQKADLAYFPYQIEFALNNYYPHHYKVDQFQNVIIGGLGGSGIAGHFVKHCFYDTAPVPIEVISNYQLPAYVNKNTLLILSSYSGNTEETMAMAEEGKEKGASVLAITTNGALEQKAQEENWPHYKAEMGFEPRMALGYSLTHMLLILDEFFGTDHATIMRDVSGNTRDTEAIIEKAENYFNPLKTYLDKKLVVLTDLYTYPVGLRFSQQMQENAKCETFVHQLPEANHNVLESYYSGLDSIFIFLNSHAHNRMDLRFDFVKNLLEKHGNYVLTIPIQSPTLSHLIQSSFLLDWIALLAADAKNINSLEIPNIKALKAALNESK